MVEIKIYYCDHWGSSKEVRNLISNYVPELKKNPNFKIDVILRPEMPPLIEIDGKALDTKYKDGKKLLKDLNKSLGL